MIEVNSSVWNFFSPTEKMLYEDGLFLLQDSLLHQNEEPTDYSYIVFPFAKLYEGFLKDLFLRLDIISERDYHSDHFRIGKVLSPNLIHRLGKRSAYFLLKQRYGEELPNKLWRGWKEGRNLVFHYFPHKFHTLTRIEAQQAVVLLEKAMEDAVAKTGV